MLHKRIYCHWRKLLNALHLVVLTFGLIASHLFAADATSHRVSGTIVTEQPIDAPILIWAIPLQQFGNGQIAYASKNDVYQSSITAKKTTAANGEYTLELAEGCYSLFAFADLNSNGLWEPEGPEPFGWLTDRPSGTFYRIRVSDEDLSPLDFTLKSPRNFPVEPRHETGGSLVTIHGYKVLQLCGDAKTRGFAHGKLLAPQIIDFFRFYILEDKLGSANAYEQGFAKFLRTNFAYPSPFVTECEALIEGMRASGAELRIP